MPHILLPFLGACLLIAMAPGPSTLLIIRNSLHSRRRGMLTVLGNETGVFLWGVVTALGVSAVLAASQAAYDAMRYAGAVVLIVFGVQALRAARRQDGAEDMVPEPVRGTVREAAPGWRAYRAGFLMNLANPKAGIFAMSFLPQFVPQGAPQLPTTVALAALWAVFEVGYYGMYVWCVGRLRNLLSRTKVRRRVEQLSGSILVALGIRLALDG